jgi:hypothetical protein
MVDEGEESSGPKLRGDYVSGGVVCQCASNCRQKAESGRLKGDCWRNIAISNNVGGVERFLSTLQHALEKEGHIALVDGLRFPTLACV